MEHWGGNRQGSPYGSGLWKRFWIKVFKVRLGSSRVMLMINSLDGRITVCAHFVLAGEPGPGDDEPWPPVEGSLGEMSGQHYDLLEMNSLQWGEAVICFCSQVKQHGNLKEKKKEAAGWQPLNLYHQREGEMKSQVKWLHHSHNTAANVIKCYEQGGQETEGDFGGVFESGLKSCITGAFWTKEKPEM